MWSLKIYLNPVFAIISGHHNVTVIKGTNQKLKNYFFEECTDIIYQ